MTMGLASVSPALPALARRLIAKNQPPPKTTKATREAERKRRAHDEALAAATPRTPSRGGGLTTEGLFD